MRHLHECYFAIATLVGFAALAPGLQSQHSVREESAASASMIATTPAVWDALCKVRPSKPVLDFGDIYTFGKGTATLRLVNHDSVTRTMLSVVQKSYPFYRLRGNTEIPAGGELEVECTMDAGLRAGPIRNKTVTVVIEGQPELVIPVRANCVSLIEADPSQVDLSQARVDSICLRSTDGRSFRILAERSDCIDFITPDSKSVHIVAPNREVILRDHVRGVFLQLDQPDCPGMFIPITERR